MATALQNVIFDMIDEIERQSTFEELRVCLARHVGELGYDRLVVTARPGAHTQLNDWMLLEQWPEGWADHYTACRYHRVSPIRHRLATAMEPFTWAEAASVPGLGPEGARVLCDAAAWGMRSGITTPVHGPDGLRGVVSLISERGAALLTPSRRMAIRMFSIVAHQKAGRLAADGQDRRADKPPLTAREIEVLRWVAAGKTNWEIGEILGKSERTIEHQIATAGRKLDAVCRAQIVAHAFRAGLIH